MFRETIVKRMEDDACYRLLLDAGVRVRSLRRDLGGTAVVAFAARYDAMKDVPLFLRAAREFLARERTGYVVMCGAGMSAHNPLCLIEGAMCGAVPVATDVGDSASIVDGRGLLTPPDPVAIAAAWVLALDRRAEFAEALAASRDRFSQTRMIAAYAALIERTHERVAVPA